MNGRRRFRIGSCFLSAAILGAAGAVSPAPVWAKAPRVAVSLLGGYVQPDLSLSDYRWDASGRADWGLEAAAGAGRFEAGLRYLRWQTRQGTGISGADDSPAVRVSRLEVLARARILSGAGFRLLGTGAVGRVHLGYSPDRLRIDTGSGPVEVSFPPVDDWSGALGMAVERDLGRKWSLGAEIERSLFAIDTAHRRGDEVVEERTTFANWNLRVRLSWMLRNN